MLDRQRGALAHRTTSHPTLVPASLRAGIVALLAATSLALAGAGPAGADVDQRRAAATPDTSLEVDPRVEAMFQRPCGSSPHGTRRTITDPLSGRVSVIQCQNGTWVPIS